MVKRSDISHIADLDSRLRKLDEEALRLLKNGSGIKMILFSGHAMSVDVNLGGTDRRFVLDIQDLDVLKRSIESDVINRITAFRDTIARELMSAGVELEGEEEEEEPGARDVDVG